MAKRRSPYETEALSASVRVTGASDALAKHTHKSKKKKKKSSAADSSSTDSYGSSGCGNQEKRGAGGSGLALVTDAERDVMNAVDAKLAALASSGGSNHSTSLKRKQMAELRASDVCGGASEKSSSPANQQQQVGGLVVWCTTLCPRLFFLLVF